MGMSRRTARGGADPAGTWACATDAPSSATPPVARSPANESSRAGNERVDERIDERGNERGMDLSEDVGRGQQPTRNLLRLRGARVHALAPALEGAALDMRQPTHDHREGRVEIDTGHG